jgi:hypothetical protein
MVEETMPAENTSPAIDSAQQALYLSAVGFTKTQGLYQNATKYVTAPFVLRQCMPYAALRAGFRVEAEDSTNDTSYTQYSWVWDGVDGTSLFHPRVSLKADTESLVLEATTPIARRFVQSVWPFYDRLFRTSLKQAGTDVPFNSFLAITILTIELQSLLLDFKHYKQMSEQSGHPTWDQLANTFGTCFKLHSAATVNRFNGLVATAAGLPGIKGLVSEIVRMKSPFMPITGNGSITVPVENMITNSTTTDAPNNVLIDEVLKRCELILNVIRSDYSDELAAMKRHMPYSLGDLNFMASLPVVADPFKTDGLMNSSFNVLNISGNEGDPETVKRLAMNVDADGVGFIPYNANLVQPTSELHYLHTTMPMEIPFLSFISGATYIQDNDGIDAEFALLSPHAIGKAAIPGAFPSLYNGMLFQTFTSADIAMADFHHVPALSAQLSYDGTDLFYMPSARPVNIDLESVLIRLDKFVEYSFDLNVVGMLDVLAQTSGAPVVQPAVNAVR